jgi:hypothetical protein
MKDIFCWNLSSSSYTHSKIREKENAPENFKGIAPMLN